MPDTGRLMVGGETRWFKFDLNEGDETVASLLILNPYGLVNHVC